MIFQQLDGPEDGEKRVGTSTPQLWKDPNPELESAVTHSQSSSL